MNVNVMLFMQISLMAGSNKQMICWWQKISGKKKKPGINSVQVNEAAIGWTKSSPGYKGDEVSRKSQACSPKLSVMGTI